MFIRTFNRQSFILRRNFSSCVTATASEIPDIFEYRQEQLSRLQDLKPADFSPVVLNQLIADFLVSPRKPDTILAGKLLDKFLFKVPEIDENGDLITLYLLQLIQENEIGQSFGFIKRILQEKDSKVPITEFMIELVWRALIDSKSDKFGFELLKTINDSKFTQFLTNEFKEKLVIDLFLPCLNWDAIDFIVSESATTQITISASVLQEVFHVLLNPVPNDSYYGPIDSEPFSGGLVNPRFHRLLQVLDRWKNSGIPIKGTQISKALEITFKTFLPTESMMNELQKLL